MRRDSEGGFALAAVIMVMSALILMVVLVLQQASNEYRNAQNQRREDSILAGADGMLERYAAKLTIDPLYYRHFVDQAELPRRCSDSTSVNYGAIVQPGNAWFDECTTWTYEAAGAYFSHPLLTGQAGLTADDIGSLFTIDPPVGSGGLTMTVVSRQSQLNQIRAIRAEIRPEAISEFAFLSNADLRFGSGAVVRGKIYVGTTLDFIQSPVKGVAYRNIYAEGSIGTLSGYGPPTLADGAQAFDSTGHYNDIRQAFPEPLDFAKFWDDLDLIRNVACTGGGLCLSRTANPGLGLSATPTAWLIQPTAGSGGAGQLRVSAAYSNTSSGCVDSEEWWWLNSQNAVWTLVGTYPIPANGVVWVEGHTVIGLPGQTSTIKGGVTIYAGSIGSPKNIVLGSDIAYNSGQTGTDVLGLIASDEVVVNPYSVGTDRVLNISGAMLTQNGAFFVSRDCGTAGNVVLPTSGGTPLATLNTLGSMAIQFTGDVAAHFSPRNYVFDTRLETLRPPLFPLLKDAWSFADWSEVPLPCWARSAGSPGCP
jgi:hypothetical protein